VGVYEITTELESAIDTNFAAKIAEVATEKSKSLDQKFTIYLRERIETFYQKSLPGIGIWIRSVNTGSRRVQRRDWSAVAIVDYFVKGEKRTPVAEQVEFGLDAMMRVIDGLATTGTILGAGELEFNTLMVHDVNELLQESGGLSKGAITAGFRIELPMRQRDEL
jgi:hypothetical protein